MEAVDVLIFYRFFLKDNDLISLLKIKGTWLKKGQGNLNQNKLGRLNSRRH